jgi:hypothetical protein
MKRSQRRALPRPCAFASSESFIDSTVSSLGFLVKLFLIGLGSITA